MEETPLSVLVVGTGVAGITCALALARQPTQNARPKITLLERALKPRTTGQALDVRGSAVEVMRNLGIEEKVKAMFTEETGTRFINSDGSTVVEFKATTGDYSLTSEFEILRSDFARVLLDELEKSRLEGVDIDVIYDESVKAIKDDGDGVQVEFTNQRVGDAAFDVVVAADGASSRTRRLIFPDDEKYDLSTATVPMGFYFSFFTIPRVEQDDNSWRWFTAPGGLVTMLRPHRNKTTMGAYMGIVLPKPRCDPELDEVCSADTATQKRHIRKRFQGSGWETDRILDAMDQSDDFYFQNIVMINVPKYNKGRCVIIGDSAHSVMGIGTSLALMGGYILAGELAKAKAGEAGSVADALARYDEVLRPIAQSAQTMMPRGLFQLINPQTKLGIGLRNLTMKVVTKTGIAPLLLRLQGDTKKIELPDYGW